MAGFGAEAVVPLQTNGPGLLAQAVAPLDRVVSPDAVAAVTDAFRKGQISADDIIERYGELAKTKEKAQITGLHEFLSPESIQARQSAVNAANTKAVLESSPEYQAAQQATFLDIKNKAEAGDNEAMRQAMLSKGWVPPAFDPKVGWTPEVRKATEDAFQEFTNYLDNQTAAQAFIANTEEKPITRTTTKIVNGQQEVTETTEPRHVYKGTTQEVDKNLFAKVQSFLVKSPNMWRHEGKPQFMEIFGAKPGKFGGGVSGPLEVPAATETFPAIGVTPKPGEIGAVVPKETAPVAAVPPTLSPTGELVTKVTTGPEKTPASELTEKEKLYSVINGSDQFQTKIDRARKQINDAIMKPVGPGYSEGSKFNRLLNGIGAFLGVDSSRLKTQTQDQLDQFLAQHVMATIRSLASTGNRVMRAEVQKEDNNPGLFYASAPRLNSTPATWNTWLTDLSKMFSDARAAALEVLPPDEQEHYALPASAAAPVTPTTPGGKVSEVSPGKKLVFDGQNYHYVQ